MLTRVAVIVSVFESWLFILFLVRRLLVGWLLSRVAITVSVFEGRLFVLLGVFLLGVGV